MGKKKVYKVAAYAILLDLKNFWYLQYLPDEYLRILMRQIQITLFNYWNHSYLHIKIIKLARFFCDFVLSILTLIPEDVVIPLVAYQEFLL